MRVNPLPRLAERSLFQEVECFYYGQVTDLVNNWTCPCGYYTWQPRHGLAPCAHCQAGILT